MKVTVKQQPEEFKPVTLEITLESREELEILNEISKLDVTIPEVLRRYGIERVEEILFSIMKETAKLIRP